MQRMFTVALLSASLAVLPSALAQRAGAHSAGGFSGGHAAAPMGHIGGGFSAHSFSGGSFGRAPIAPRSAPLFTSAPRSFTSVPRFTSTAPNRAFVPGYRVPYTAPSADRRRDNHGVGGNSHRPPYRGYGGYPYVYANSWELLPWDLGYSDFIGDNGYDNDSAYDPLVDPAQQQQPAAAPDDAYGPGYDVAPPPPYPAWRDAAAPDANASEPELTLIFNDGHTQAIHNYVLTADTLVVLDQAASGHQQRIDLASLNLPATEQAAQQAGLDFTPPAVARR